VSDTLGGAVGGAGLGFQVGGPWGAAIGGVGGAIYGGIAARGARRKAERRRRRAIAELRSAFPTGLTSDDLRAGELTRGRLSEGVRGEQQLAGYEIARRSRARGLAGSPSEERSRARLEQQSLLGIEHAGETTEEQLYNVRLGREGARQQAELAIFGEETGAAATEQTRQGAQDAAFWNSLNEFVPTIQKYLPKGDVTAGTTAGRPSTYPGFNPAGPSIRRPGPLPF